MSSESAALPSPPPASPALPSPLLSSATERLKHHGAVVFGTETCKFTRKFKSDWSSALASGDITYVPCDSGRDADAVCRRVGVSMTPTLIFGGVSLAGYHSPAQIADHLAYAVRTTAKLASKGAVLYGRGSCEWTGRQMQVLARDVDVPQRVAYVDCDVEKPKCDAAGIAAVPAWSVSGSKPIYGYRKMTDLGILASFDAATLDREAAASKAALDDNRAAVCR